MANPYSAGRIGRDEAREIAERATDYIMGRTKPQAVCLDPDGRVTVEPVAEAVEEDIVGVYTRTPGLIALYREVRDNLVFCVEERGITGESVPRRGVWAGKARRAA